MGGSGGSAGDNGNGGKGGSIEISLNYHYMPSSGTLKQPAASMSTGVSRRLRRQKRRRRQRRSGGGAGGPGGKLGSNGRAGDGNTIKMVGSDGTVTFQASFAR